MDNNLKREIIMDHYSHPVNKGLFEDSRYLKINMNNESCIDEVNLMILIEEGIIKDIRFDGEACAISTSSTSIMIETLINKDVASAIDIIDNFEKMIGEESFNRDILELSLVYEDIAKQPNRKKCALLSWWGLKKILKEYKDEN